MRPIRPGARFQHALSRRTSQPSRVSHGRIGAGTICLEGGGACRMSRSATGPRFSTSLACSPPSRSRRNRHGASAGRPSAGRKFSAPGSAVGSPGTTYGLPRFAEAAFAARFPFAKVALTDPSAARYRDYRLESFRTRQCGCSSLPVAALEYRFTNRSATSLEAVFSFNAKNFLADEKGAAESARGAPGAGGFTLWNGAPPDKPWEESAFCAE